MRVLVVGAGIAGLTLAARLCQLGHVPTVVERSVSLDVGYAIGLYPLGSRVLQGLGCYQNLVDHSLRLERDEVAGRAGKNLLALDLGKVVGASESVMMIKRIDLLDVLEASCSRANLRRGVTVDALSQHRDYVEVTVSNGSTERFDCVIGCDGEGSDIRERVFGSTSGYDARWAIWTWWVASDRPEPGIAREWWGAGTVFGTYPVSGHMMCIIGSPVESRQGKELKATLSVLLDRVPSTLRAPGDAPDYAHQWLMRDVRAATWVSGRVALCGDAAVSYMPTAGVGASNAMWAADALADKLSRAGTRNIPVALEAYERRCRVTVERNQTESRHLARLMFVPSSHFAWCRDMLVGHIPPRLT